ncbi:MFS transporter [Hymenobacter jejuensis]|uniref:MFS transporter n=1 Tax=Hymenobacter jejuensis TaxID=2502781 RepID=UPI001E60C166|nr:MFS transporter [Hymenobacter jejuensis]
MGSFHGLWSLASFLGGALGALLIGWGQTPLTHFLLVAAVCAFLTLAANRHTLRHESNDSTGSSGLTLRRPDPYLLRIGLIALCGMLCEGCMFDWSGVYFQKVVHAEKAMVASGYVACMSTMALGRFVSDYFTHRFGATRMMQVSSLLITIGLLLAVAFPYLMPSLIGFLLVGFGIASVTPLSYSAAGRATTVSPGVALAVVSTLGYLGFLFGPPLIGLLAEAFSLRVSFTLVAVMGMLVGILSAIGAAQEKAQTIVA